MMVEKAVSSLPSEEAILCLDSPDWDRLDSHNTTSLAPSTDHTPQTLSQALQVDSLSRVTGPSLQSHSCAPEGGCCGWHQEACLSSASFGIWPRGTQEGSERVAGERWGVAPAPSLLSWCGCICSLVTVPSLCSLMSREGNSPQTSIRPRCFTKSQLVLSP